MKVRITGGGDDGKKGAPKPPTPAEVSAAEKFAKELAVRRGLITAINIFI